MSNYVPRAPKKGLSKKEMNIVVIVVLGLGLGWVIGQFKKPAENIPTSIYMSTPTPSAVPAWKAVTKFDAYGMACEFFCKQTGWPHETKFTGLWDECIENGGNSFVIVGTASYDGSKKRWTAGIKYDERTKLWDLEYGSIEIMNLE